MLDAIIEEKILLVLERVCKYLLLFMLLVVYEPTVTEYEFDSLKYILKSVEYLLLISK